MENRIYDAFKDIKAEEQLKEDTLKKIYEKADKNQHFPVRRTVLATCASLLLVLFISMFSYNLYFTESAYIDIDVNPSIELTINRFNRVIDAYAYNEEGNKILETINLKHKSYDKAVADIIGEMEKEGYLRNDGLVSATLRTDWEEEGRLKKLEQTVADQLKESHNNSNHEIYTVDSVTKKHAHEENVSPAKYLAILELQKIAPNTTVEGCKDHSISEIREEIYSHEMENHNQNESNSNHEMEGDSTENSENNHNDLEDDSHTEEDVSTGESENNHADLKDDSYKANGTSHDGGENEHSGHD